jgi:hypothetical protein
MSKSLKASEEPASFERFQKALKALLAVPRREIQDKLDARRNGKKRQKKLKG